MYLEYNFEIKPIIHFHQASWSAALFNSWKWNDEDIDQNTMDQMMKQRDDFDKNTTNQSDQKCIFPFQKTYWNKQTTLGESWKFNDEDFDQNTMDQMMKQRDDLQQDQTGQTGFYPFQKLFQSTVLQESWKWNDEDIDQNTMDQMIKQREDFDHNNMTKIKHRSLDDEAAWKEIMKWESRHNNEKGSMRPPDILEPYEISSYWVQLSTVVGVLSEKDE